MGCCIRCFEFVGWSDVWDITLWSSASWTGVVSVCFCLWCFTAFYTPKNLTRFRIALLFISFMGDHIKRMNVMCDQKKTYRFVKFFVLKNLKPPWSSSTLKFLLPLCFPCVKYLEHAVMETLNRTEDCLVRIPHNDATHRLMMMWLLLLQWVLEEFNALGHLPHHCSPPTP